jgi:hypothetical protein
MWSCSTALGDGQVEAGEKVVRPTYRIPEWSSRAEEEYIGEDGSLDLFPDTDAVLVVVWPSFGELTFPHRAHALAASVQDGRDADFAFFFLLLDPLPVFLLRLLAQQIKRCRD